MSACRSINIPNVQTRIDILKTITGADVVGAAKIFERETGEKEILCQNTIIQHDKRASLGQMTPRI
jgi:hypothetical protein